MSVLSAAGRHGIGMPFGRLYRVRRVETIVCEEENATVIGRWRTVVDGDGVRLSDVSALCNSRVNCTRFVFRPSIDTRRRRNVGRLIVGERRRQVGNARVRVVYCVMSRYVVVSCILFKFYFYIYILYNVLSIGIFYFFYFPTRFTIRRIVFDLPVLRI